MSRHNAPCEPAVTLGIEVEEGVLDDCGDARIGEEPLAVSLAQELAHRFQTVGCARTIKGRHGSGRRPMKTSPASVAAGMSTATLPGLISFNRTIPCRLDRGAGRTLASGPCDQARRLRLPVAGTLLLGRVFSP